MPKLNWQDQRGQSDNRPIVVIAAVTIIAALMIVGIFIMLSGRRTPDTATSDFLRNLERQRPGRESPTGNQTGAPARETYRGVLTEIKTDVLVITESNTQNKITVSLTNDTPLTYNGQGFDRSRFYVGDQLEVTAKNTGGQLRAESIIVLISASPATDKPAPPAVNVQPDGSIKSL